MKNRIGLSLAAIFLIISCTVISARSHKDKDKKKEKLKEEDNLCKVEGNSAAMHCFCDSEDMNNATKANCWIFTELSRDHNVWNVFSTQSRLMDLSITVRPDTLFTFVPTRALKQLPRLTRLEIKYASIAHIHNYAFANLTSLLDINLSRNKIETLKEMAFAHLHGLQVLTLDENRISELNRDVFVDLPSLQKLYMMQNNLSVIHDYAFKHLGELQELELNKNQLYVITRNIFAGLGSLKRLDLSVNRLDMLGDLTFAELWSLEELMLDNNALQYVSERAFVGLEQLKKLSLSRNKLKELTAGLLDEVPSVSNLDLRFNELTTLTYTNIRPIIENLYNDTSYLFIEQNKFVCDCRLAWMFTLRNETKNLRIRNALDEVICYMEQSDTFGTLSPVLGGGSGRMNLGLGTNSRSHPGDNNALSSYNYEDDPMYDDNYDDQQQDGTFITPPSSAHSDNLAESSPVKHLLDIPLDSLPCPEGLRGPPANSDAVLDNSGFPLGAKHSRCCSLTPSTITIVGMILIFKICFT